MKYLTVIFVLLFTSLASAQIQFVGIQRDLPISDLESSGWVRCFTDSYISQGSISRLFNSCTGDRLLIACGKKNSEVLTMAASVKRESIIVQRNKVFFEENNTRFFNSRFDSIGFMEEDVQMTSYEDCTSSNGGDVLCWRSSNALDQEMGSFLYKGNCGEPLQFGNGWEFYRIVYTKNSL